MDPGVEVGFHPREDIAGRGGSRVEETAMSRDKSEWSGVE